MNIIFLDRDGVINEYPGHGKYVTSLRQFKFIKGAKEAIALLTKCDFDIYVISNQAGVSKKLFKKTELNRITRKMLTQIEKTGGRIKKVMYCIHEEKHDCVCRKPKTGLFFKAVDGREINFKNVYFIGDDKRDIQTGRNLGCRTVLVFSGKSRKKDLSNWECLPDRVANNLLEAVKKIVLPVKKDDEDVE